MVFFTANIVYGHWTLNQVRSTLAFHLERDDWEGWLISNKCFLFRAPTQTAYVQALQVGTLYKSPRCFGGKIVLRTWEDYENDLRPNVDPVSWARIEGFPEFFRYNFKLVSEALKTVGRVIELDSCEHSYFDHRFLFLKMQFYTGVRSQTDFVAHINNSEYFLTVTRWDHSHHTRSPQEIIIGLDENELNFLDQRVYSEDLKDVNTSDQFDIMGYEPKSPTSQLWKDLRDNSIELIGPERGWREWPKSPQQLMHDYNFQEEYMPPPQPDSPDTPVHKSSKTRLMKTLVKSSARNQRANSVPEASRMAKSNPFTLNICNETKHQEDQ